MEDVRRIAGGNDSGLFGAGIMPPQLAPEVFGKDAVFEEGLDLGNWVDGNWLMVDGHRGALRE
jgi:hypothetical protein